MSARIVQGSVCSNLYSFPLISHCLGVAGGAPTREHQQRSIDIPGSPAVPPTGKDLFQQSHVGAGCEKCVQWVFCVTTVLWRCVHAMGHWTWK